MASHVSANSDGWLFAGCTDLVLQASPSTGTSESASDKSSLLHRWKRTGHIPDWISHLGQFPGHRCSASSQVQLACLPGNDGSTQSQFHAVLALSPSCVRTLD